METAPGALGAELPCNELPGPVAPSAGRRGLASGRAGGRRWWLALALIGALLVVGAYWAGTKATSPAALTRRYAPAPRTMLTSPVVLRRLSETLAVQGVIAAPSGYSVDFGPVSVPGAQPIVTQQPPRPGAVMTSGSLLAQVAGRPVFALAGATPMYRDLMVGDHGPDVAQLQGDLAALGSPAGTAPGF